MAAAKQTPKVPTAEELEKKAADDKAALEASLAADAAAAEAAKKVEGTGEADGVRRHANGDPWQPAGARKVPTLEEVIAAGYTPEVAAKIVAEETELAKLEAADDAAAANVNEAAPFVEPAPKVRHKVRVENFFYWRQGPGLPGVPVNPGETLLLEQAEIEAIVAQGANVSIIDENLRARAIAILERLPSHMVDPAPLADGIAEFERLLTKVVDDIIAFEKSKGSGG